jgi:hypothetical protein
LIYVCFEGLPSTITYFYHHEISVLTIHHLFTSFHWLAYGGRFLDAIAVGWSGCSSRNGRQTEANGKHISFGANLTVGGIGQREFQPTTTGRTGSRVHSQLRRNRAVNWSSQHFYRLYGDSNAQRLHHTNADL